jgi:hypothetical protein
MTALCPLFSRIYADEQRVNSRHVVVSLLQTRFAMRRIESLISEVPKVFQSFSLSREKEYHCWVCLPDISDKFTPKKENHCNINSSLQA